MDYAIKKGVSLSTLRRHIKANKLIYKVENGRYLLWAEDTEEIEPPIVQKDDSSLLQNRLSKMTQDLKRAQEEIAELKTLIALYEEKIPPNRLNI